MLKNSILKYTNIYMSNSYRSDVFIGERFKGIISIYVQI